MAVKMKVDIPVANITSDSIPVEIELEEKGIGGALLLLVQQKTGLDDRAVGNLSTNEEGSVFLLNSAGEVEEEVVKADKKMAALVDAMNALLFDKPRKLGDKDNDEDKDKKK